MKDFRTELDVLEFCVHGPDGYLLAATVHVEDAATLVSSLDEGGTIRHRDGLVLWTEGEDGVAVECDIAAEVYERLANRTPVV